MQKKNVSSTTIKRHLSGSTDAVSEKSPLKGLFYHPRNTPKRHGKQNVYLAFLPP